MPVAKQALPDGADFSAPFRGMPFPVIPDILLVHIDYSQRYTLNPFSSLHPSGRMNRWAAPLTNYDVQNSPMFRNGFVITRGQNHRD